MDPFEKKKIWSWAFYDWANSAYSTTVMAAFFPVFFKSYWSQGTEAVVTTARLGTVISISSLLIALLSPTLGVMADLKGFKKLFCMIFTVCGILACASMGVIPSGEWLWALIAYGVAMMAFNAASVFYDSLLPFVASRRHLDFASSLGYSLGYLGGGVLLTINVLMSLFPQSFGLADATQAVKLSFFMVAVWWLVFSLPLAKNIPEPKIHVSSENLFKLSQHSLRKLVKTVADLVQQKNLALFILAYWLYIDGVYTVMTMAVDYGISIGFQSKDLIAALLITQFIGFPCAYYFGTITKRWGPKKPILFCIGIYSLTVIAATYMSAAWHFYLLALVIGMVQGGVQSLSRSMFAQMITKEASGEYFGLFNMVGRFASILGPLVVAFGVTVTGNSRMGMVGLLVLFIAGGWLLSLVTAPAAYSEQKR